MTPLFFIKLTNYGGKSLFTDFIFTLIGVNYKYDHSNYITLLAVRTTKMCENVHFDGNTLPSQLKEMFSFQFRYLNERQADQGK